MDFLAISGDDDTGKVRWSWKSAKSTRNLS